MNNNPQELIWVPETLNMATCDKYTDKYVFSQWDGYLNPIPIQNLDFDSKIDMYTDLTQYLFEYFEYPKDFFADVCS